MSEEDTKAFIISIHAPHARSDVPSSFIHRAILISIHAPHARSDFYTCHCSGNGRFQSTLLMRGATRQETATSESLQFQSTLLMRGATLPAITLLKKSRFQSTLLMRGATNQKAAGLATRDISIHAPHARSDNFKRIESPIGIDFNPRSSCEERRHRHISAGLLPYFNPRSSCEERPT
mgnify:CR=1 FL=1